jgi:hypothetical protein
LGFNATVSALAIQPDGKNYAGGDFVSYNGNTANKIIRLNTDGSIGTFLFQVWDLVRVRLLN